MSKNRETMARLFSLVAVGWFCLIGGDTAAGTFVSFNGEFHFTYPDAWVQIDYHTAEYYLTRGNPDAEVDFEAVFSERETFVIYQGQYLILTVDTVGTMTEEQIDSVLAGLAVEFDRPLKEVSSEAFLSGPMRDSIAFDRANGLVAIESEVAGSDAGPRINLLVMKFYDKGIANYYFYAPAVEFVSSLAFYREIVTSFSTEPLSDTAREEVRVADLDDDDNNTGATTALYGGLVVILIAIIASRARARAKKK